MARTYDELSEDLIEWIGRQKIFFVATAPLDGHINLSPKGYDTLRVLDPRRVAYLDLTGSGVETVAHLRHDGRITLMFCAFEGAPRILRLYGRGQVHPVDSEGFDALRPCFTPRLGMRSIITVDIERISTACGFAVPAMSYEGERHTLDEWAERKGDVGLVRYRAEANAASIDGLPGLA